MIFSHLVCKKMQVKGLLHILCIELNPARVTKTERVLLIIPDGKRSTDCTVCNRHDYRLSHTGNIENDFCHEQETL